MRVEIPPLTPIVTLIFTIATTLTTTPKGQNYHDHNHDDSDLIRFRSGWKDYRNRLLHRHESDSYGDDGHCNKLLCQEENLLF